ncbi:MAG: DNA polymerase III subunit delta [Chloroflexota bacterium]
MYLLHGEDHLRRREAVKQIMPAPGSDEYAGVSTFDAPVDVQAIVEAASALPFLTSRRYVLVRNLIQGGGRHGGSRRTKGVAGDDEPDEGPSDEPREGKSPAQRLRDALPNLPDTTTLVMEEAGKVPASSVIYKYARGHGEEREFRPLQGGELAGWIRDRFSAGETPVTPAAVETLMAFVGPDLLLLEQEIEKLTTYAAGHTVTETDVAEMVASAEETKVWSMIDLAAMGKGPEALTQLRRVLADSANPPLRTLGAIVNRFRTMLLVKALADQWLSDFAIGQKTGQPDWSVRNTRPLVRNFSVDQLTLVYERLLATDTALKLSPLDPKLTLELLVLDIADRRLGVSLR